MVCGVGRNMIFTGIYDSTIAIGRGFSKIGTNGHWDLFPKWRQIFPAFGELRRRSYNFL